MNIINLILAAILFYLCISDARRCKSCAQRKAELSVEGLRQLRYEYIKNQILNKLHLKQPPKTNLPKPPLKSLLVIAEMAQDGTVLDTDDQPKTESVVIYPRYAHLPCKVNDLMNPCDRFEFVIPESLSFDHFVSAELWFYTEVSPNYIQVQQIIDNPFEKLRRSLDLNNMMMEKSHEFWRRYSLINNNFQSDSGSENMIAFELFDIRNETDSDNVVRATGDEGPFLIIRSDVTEISSREKRSSTCVESSTSCCKENFFLNFSEIRWDNWILHPDGYQANFCRGRCFNDLSNTRFYHSAVLLSYIRDNKDIAEEIGLNMCCTPSVMAPVTIIYRNEEGLIYHKSIENMKVESCNCA